MHGKKSFAFFISHGQPCVANNAHVQNSAYRPRNKSVVVLQPMVAEDSLQRVGIREKSIEIQGMHAASIIIISNTLAIYYFTQMNYKKNERAKKKWILNHPQLSTAKFDEDKMLTTLASDTTTDGTTLIERSEFLTACNTGDTEKVRLFLKENIDIYQKDGKGATAVMLASKGGHTIIIEMLLKKCASDKGILSTEEANSTEVNIQDNDGKSSLMYASSNGHTEVAKLLLDRDAQAQGQK